MKSGLLILAFVLTSLSMPAAGKDQGTLGPTVAESIKGRLGVTQGTAVPIEAEIVKVADPKNPDLDLGYGLKVLRVDGKDLAEKPVFRYRAEKDLMKKLPTGVFELHRMKTGKNVDEMTPEEVEAAEKGYVGRTLMLMATEIEEAPVKGQGKERKESVLLLSKCLGGL